MDFGDMGYYLFMCCIIVWFWEKELCGEKNCGVIDVCIYC